MTFLLRQIIILIGISMFFFTSELPAVAEELTGKQVMSSANVAEVLAVMATAGLYDDSGQWLYLTGLPAKSGVGGGIIAVSPGRFGIAVISPPLDPAGNSVRAQKAIADISNTLGGNPYEVTPIE